MHDKLQSKKYAIQYANQHVKKPDWQPAQSVAQSHNRKQIITVNHEASRSKQMFAVDIKHNNL